MSQGSNAPSEFSNGVYLTLGLTILALTAVVLLSVGRTPWYKYGAIRVWSGNISSSENSQQIADPYSFTHITHGVAFYAVLRLVAPQLSLGLRALAALSVESIWEVFENTDMVIQRYRTATLSLDYYGDSVVNSIFDILFCLFGFFMASRLPSRLTLVLLFAIEIILAALIRDNLFLNILLLIYPVPVIKNWQLGG